MHNLEDRKVAFTLDELQSMITVDMGDYKLARGSQRLITRDLGSCVAVAMRDPQTGVGGLLHIMLPRYTDIDLGTERNLAKYADTGIEELVKNLVMKGAKRERLVVKLAGGAHMVRSEGVSESSDISSRNVSAVKQKLMKMNIPVLAAELGGYHPRTVIFEPGSGTFRILTAGKTDRTL